MEPRRYGAKRAYGNAKRGVAKPRKNGLTDKSVDSMIRNSVNSNATRQFDGELRKLMTEAEKADAQVLELSYDFSCRIIRLYKFLNNGKLEKADRDIIDALGRQLVRSATSINANMNEAQHPQSDADFLSKASISLKEARESENWLNLLRDNGYLTTKQAESIIQDCVRINKILITITTKVRKRLNG